VNFCKFTNETRLAIEDACTNSGQRYLAAISGGAAGGGYELALTADHLMLVDDRRSAVSLPELPLLAVLSGTGGLTRLTDKRKMRRDRADVFCTAEEGVRGKRAVEWRLVDEIVPPSAWEATVLQRAQTMAALSDRPEAKGIALTPLRREITETALRYPHVGVALDRPARTATITIRGPD
jgi:benzoyl-CoA-dihydrodiol lyase